MVSKRTGIVSPTPAQISILAIRIQDGSQHRRELCTKLATTSSNQAWVSIAVSTLTLDCRTSCQSCPSLAVKISDSRLGISHISHTDSHNQAVPPSSSNFRQFNPNRDQLPLKQPRMTQYGSPQCWLARLQFGDEQRTIHLPHTDQRKQSLLFREFDRDPTRNSIIEPMEGHDSSRQASLTTPPTETNRRIAAGTRPNRWRSSELYQTDNSATWRIPMHEQYAGLPKQIKTFDSRLIDR